MKYNVDYVLFTHLPNDTTAWRALRDSYQKIVSVLNHEFAKGVLYIFIDPGWLQLLNTIGQDFDPIKLTNDFNVITKREAEFQAIINGDLRDAISDKDVPDRIMLITAKDLFPILNNIRGNKPGVTATKLKRYLVADDPGVRYDTTKVVEAIIRIRHLGTGIPILRMDWDALFNSNTLVRDLPLVTRDIPGTCERLSKNHRIYSYMISGSYEMPSKNYAEWSINDFNTAFATRMFPALIPTPAACGLLNKDNRPVIDEALDENTLEQLGNLGLFDINVMMEYYGVGQKITLGGGLSSLGSDPLQSVISGAALVLSDGAILDLPPFSNFRENVMWIDDHLKYELHRALGHFPESINDPPVTPGRLKEYVFKDRLLAGQGKIRYYTLGVYIPTLYLGILMDAWIRAPDSLLVATLQDALRRGEFDTAKRALLVEWLFRMAIIRTNELISQWSRLRTASGKSFAALWVSGTKSEIELALSGSTIRGGDWLGWGLSYDGKASIDNLEQFNEAIRALIIELADDVCNYIDWTLYWPSFVQSVRSLENGSLRLDVRYVSKFKAG